MNPDDIKPNATVSIELPRLVSAIDYHEFGVMQNMLQHDLGLTQVYVTEVGFDFNTKQYIGLVHLDLPSHNNMVMELDSHYKELAQAA